MSLKIDYLYLHESVGCLDTVELCLEDRVLDGVVAGRRDVGDGAHALWRQHHLVLRDQVVLTDVAVDVAAAHVRPDPEIEQKRLVTEKNCLISHYTFQPNKAANKLSASDLSPEKRAEKNSEK